MLTATTKAPAMKKAVLDLKHYPLTVLALKPPPVVGKNAVME